MGLYYVEIDAGCGIREAKSKEQAWRDLVKAEGTNHAKFVRKATKKDIEHVRSMGGYVPSN